LSEINVKNQSINIAFTLMSNGREVLWNHNVHKIATTNLAFTQSAGGNNLQFIASASLSINP
jgi:hypothetical protein